MTQRGVHQPDGEPKVFSGNAAEGIVLRSDFAPDLVATDLTQQCTGDVVGDQPTRKVVYAVCVGAGNMAGSLP